MLVGILRRGSGMTGSGGMAEVVPVVGSERFCRSDALNCLLSRPLGADFGTGTVCAVEVVAAPATEIATAKANAARVLATVNGSAGRNLEIRVNARSCRFPPNLSCLEAKGVSFFRENISPSPISPGLI